MIIDSHVKVGKRFTGKEHSIEEYMKHMEAESIKMAVLCPNKPLSYNIEEGNDYVENILNKYPDKFWGAIRVDPWKKEKTVEFLEKRLTNKNFKAIYLHPWEENFQCNRGIILPVIDYAKENKLPVIIEAGYIWASHISQIGDIARQYPEVKFLATNAGQLDLSGLTLSNVKYILKKYKNIYMGTASAVAAEWLAELVKDSGKGRILFESGHPLFEAKLEKYRIDCSYLDENQKQEVFCDNAMKFLEA